MNEKFFQPPGESIKAYLERHESFIDSIQTEEDVEKVALSVLEEDEYAKEVTVRIHRSRERGKEDEFSVRQLKSFFDEVKLEIALVSNVEIDAVEHAKQKKQFREQVKELVSNIDQKKPDEKIMEDMGIIRPVSGTKGYVFDFPSEIFPQFVTEQWNAYMGLVKQFEVAANKLRAGVITQVDFSGIDLMRKKAHNTVSQSIGEILEFDGWDLEDYRRFVAKMRDKKYDEYMGEVARYAGAFKNEFIGDEHLSKINKAIRNQA